MRRLEETNFNGPLFLQLLLFVLDDERLKIIFETATKLNIREYGKFELELNPVKLFE